MSRRDRPRGPRRLDVLYEAQGGICAGCGEPMPAPGVALHDSDNERDVCSFDHVVPRCEPHRGPDTLDNGLAMHRRCNEAKADRPPNGCDLLWQTLVRARLGSCLADIPASARTCGNPAMLEAFRAAGLA